MVSKLELKLDTSVGVGGSLSQIHVQQQKLDTMLRKILFTWESLTLDGRTALINLPVGLLTASMTAIDLIRKHMTSTPLLPGHCYWRFSTWSWGALQNYLSALEMMSLVTIAEVAAQLVMFSAGQHMLMKELLALSKDITHHCVWLQHCRLTLSDMDW